MPFVVWILGWCALMSVISFLLYGWDKRAASGGRWRTKERTLLLFDVLGGWPGGLIGQRVWKHKRRKFAYMWRFWSIVVAHVIFWSAWLWWRINH